MEVVRSLGQGPPGQTSWDHRSPEHRTGRSLQGAQRCWRAGGEEAGSGRNGVRLPDLACFLEGVWERWATGEAAASPPCPPPLRPAGSLRNPKRGQAPCQGEGCQARPGRQLPTQMVPMCWSWPDSLPANSHGDGVAAMAGSRAGVRAFECGGGGGLHAAPSVLG